MTNFLVHLGFYSGFFYSTFFHFFQYKLHQGKPKFIPKFVRNATGQSPSLSAIIVIVAKYSVGRKEEILTLRLHRG